VFGEVIKDHVAHEWADPPALVFAGASAGTVSAIVSAVDFQLHAEPRWRPEESMHFRLWVGLGLHDGEGSLDYYGNDGRAERRGTRGHSDERPPNRWLYNTDGIQRMVDGVVHETTGASPGWKGRIRVGAQTSRVYPYEDRDITTHIMEPFGFELDGFTARFLHARDTGLVKSKKEIALTELGRLARASGAFPIVFAPVELDCTGDGWSYEDALITGRSCTRPVLLMDGGLFDNNPLQLAYDLAETNDDELVIIYPDPDLAKSRDEPMVSPHIADPRTAEISAFISSVRLQAVANFRRTHSAVPMVVPQRTAPISNDLAAFQGFYDTSFRIWDFYAGMTDALDFLEGDTERLGLSLSRLKVARAKLRQNSAFAGVDCAFEGLQRLYDDRDRAVDRLHEPTNRKHRKIRREVWEHRTNMLHELARNQPWTDAGVLPDLVRMKTMEWTERDGFEHLRWSSTRRASELDDAVDDDAGDLREALIRLTTLAMRKVVGRLDPDAVGKEVRPRHRLQTNSLVDLGRGTPYPAHDLRYVNIGLLRIAREKRLAWLVRYRSYWAFTRGSRPIRGGVGEDMAVKVAAIALTGSKRATWLDVGPQLELSLTHQWRLGPVGLEGALAAGFDTDHTAFAAGPGLTVMWPSLEPTAIGPLAPFQLGVGMGARAHTAGAAFPTEWRPVGSVPIYLGPHVDLLLVQAVRLRFGWQPDPGGFHAAVGIKAPFPIRRRPYPGP
jgi:hypothetical protein